MCCPQALSLIHISIDGGAAAGYEISAGGVVADDEEPGSCGVGVQGVAAEAIGGGGDTQNAVGHARGRRYIATHTCRESGSTGETSYGTTNAIGRQPGTDSRCGIQAPYTSCCASSSGLALYSMARTGQVRVHTDDTLAAG